MLRRLLLRVAADSKKEECYEEQITHRVLHHRWSPTRVCLDRLVMLARVLQLPISILESPRRKRYALRDHQGLEMHKNQTQAPQIKMVNMENTRLCMGDCRYPLKDNEKGGFYHIEEYSAGSNYRSYSIRIG